MSTIDKVTMPDGIVVDIEDAQAREDIAKLKKAKRWIGVTTTVLTEGSTTNPIVINGESVTAIDGDVAGYQSDEFTFNGTIWQKNDLSFLGTLAYKDTASGSYTPHGTISTPNITVTPSNTTIKNPTSKQVVDDIATAAPNASIAGAITYCELSGTNLILKNIIPSKGASITTENITVLNGITSAVATQPSFTGTSETITVS